jgi:riboflavin synthase
MFTGIVRLGRVGSIEMQGASGRITVTPDRPWEEPVGLGDSIAVNGACLTVASLEGN